MPYRDDDHALESKNRELEQERARIERQKRAFAQLVEDEVRKRRATREKNLPFLGKMRIANPCHADWNAMIGDEQARFCGNCSRIVYNISAMTTEQTESLLRTKEGKLCIRLSKS